MQLVHINIDDKELKDFDNTVTILKELKILSENDTRSSLIQEFVRVFTKEHKELLKEEKIYSREIYPSEKGEEM
jgi:hypothetical protein